MFLEEQKKTTWGPIAGPRPPTVSQWHRIFVLRVPRLDRPLPAKHKKKYHVVVLSWLFTNCVLSVDVQYIYLLFLYFPWCMFVWIRYKIVVWVCSVLFTIFTVQCFFATKKCFAKCGYETPGKRERISCVILSASQLLCLLPCNHYRSTFVTSVAL